MQTVIADGESLSLTDVVAVARGGAPVALTDDPVIRQRLLDTLALRRRSVAKGQPVYGVTTGPGSSVNRHVGADRAADLQSHFVTLLGCGVGDTLSVPECRAMLLARVNCLVRGYSGVRSKLVDGLVSLLNHDVIPCVPTLGSVGASGDLIPSSYVAAVLMGHREAFYRGSMRPAAEALAEAGLEPLQLEPKEGLGLVNGTSFMTGIGILATEDARDLATIADACTAMAAEVLEGIRGPFDPFLHDSAKPHPGQIVSAARIRALVEGSGLTRDYSSLVDDLGTLDSGVRSLQDNIQDIYSLRCAPQCVGALHDAITWVSEVMHRELNSSNDNPLFDPEADQVHSGGNFSGFHVGLAMDTLKTAVASVADLIERQFALVNDERTNRGLGVCCANPLPEDHPEAGMSHGFRGVQLAISAVTAEALNACTPMTVFSRSTACHVQDKVSMAAAAARQAREVVDLSQRVAAMHLLITCQAADLRGANKLAAGTRRIYEAVREVSEFVEVDRELDGDIRRVTDLVRSRRLGALIDGG